MHSFNSDHLVPLRESLPQFDDGGRLPRSGLFDAYCNWYSLDRVAQSAKAQHYAYRVSALEYDLVEQRFRLPNARFNVFLIHGYTDHAGIYGPAIEYWLSRGANVTIIDNIGHGLSSGDRANIETFDHYMQVIASRLDHWSREASLPLVLQGQSMGGAILHTLLQSPTVQEYTALAIANNPLVFPTNWHLVKKKWRIGRWFKRSVVRTFTESSNDASYLEFVREKDVLQPKITPLKWVGAMLRWIDAFLKIAPVTYSPHIIFQGTDDQTVDGPEGVRVLKQKFRDADIVEITGARHHLVNESEAIRKLVATHIDRHLEKLSLID